MGIKTMNGGFFCCERCGKKLIKRLSNGLWHFVYGGKPWKEGKAGKRTPVNLYIHGSLRMQCLSDSCGHWNVLHYFPVVPAESPDNGGEENDEERELNSHNENPAISENARKE